jgi:4-amino-4-deoxy-L-arabinose transferase-like glycosyltransferase
MVVVWVAFAVRLLFYSAMLPLWEGYDEWAHFAVVRRMVNRGQLLVSRQAPIPRDVETSFELAPVPWEMRSLAPPSYTEGEFWKLSSAERERRETALRTMPAAWGSEDGTGAFPAYEALQPPLYYWAMAPALWACRGLGAGLVGQVLALRFLSSLLASLAVPLVFLLGRQVWGGGREALGVAAIVAVMPGLALDVARVGNDCLAVVLFTLLTWLAVKAVNQGLSRKLAAAMGLALGLGLLTKAYFLTAIPAVLAVWVYGAWKARDAGRALAAGCLSVLVAGWWYWHNLASTRTLSGLSESVMLRHVGAGEMLRRSAGIHWGKAIDVIFFSHLYFGGWSSLTVRSWMYHAFYVVIALAAVGLVRELRRPAILTLLAVYLGFWLGHLYNVALLYISKGLAGSMGWYMYAVVGAEVTLSVAGLRRLAPARASGWIAAGGAAMFALLDLYAVHAVAIPYYTGMIRHRASGSLGALHWAELHGVGLGGAVERLAVFKSPYIPPGMLVVLWMLYCLGTIAAVAGASVRTGCFPDPGGGRKPWTHYLRHFNAKK